MKIAYLKRSHIFVGLVACLSVGHQLVAVLQGVDTQGDFERFVQKYQPPAELRALVDANKDTLVSNGSEGIYGQHIPGLYFKGSEIERIINGERLRAVFKQYDLDLLDVAREYIHEINGQWTVIAERVEKSQTDFYSIKLTLKQVQQLATVAEKTGFRDWGVSWAPNWIFNTNGKLVCVDTENSSFNGCDYSCLEVLRRFEREPDAAQWLDGRTKSLIATYENIISLRDRQDLDDPAINVENVKNHLKEINRQQKR
jgi:hypothetical protein